MEDNHLSSIPEKILNIIPLAMVALMLISGAIFFLLSPISFFVPKFLSNPFSNVTATNVLASFSVITICALILGVVFFTINDAVLGNDGLNHKVRQLLKKKPIEPAKEEDLEPIREEDKEDFYRWIKHNDDAAKYYDFVFLKDSVIKGLLLGFELSFLADIVYYFLLLKDFVIKRLLLGYLAKIALLPWLPSLNLLNYSFYGKIIISGIFFLFAFAYDKKVWRKDFKERVFYKIYLSERKRTPST